jgi:cell division septum initiation protein DivIVA
MKAGERKAAPDSRAVQTKVRELRAASFSASRKGFDRDEVMTYLHRLASWLEGAGLADPDEVRRELSMVGQRTSEILTKAEETANALRTEAQRSAGEVLESARSEAERMRTEAEEEVRRTRHEADSRADDVAEEADRRAERMIDEAVKRRQHLEVLIDDLITGRDEILADTRRLVEELNQLVGSGAEEEPEQAAEESVEAEEGGRVEGATVSFAELDDEQEAGELDGEPDFSLRDRVAGVDADSEAEPEELDPDAEEHSPERASPGAP